MMKIHFALALIGLAAAHPALAGGTAIFHFSSDPVSTATTFTNTNNGISATFSSPADPGGFTVDSSFFTTLSGNVLINGLENDKVNIPLDVDFSQSLKSLSLNFVTNATSPFVVDFYSGGIDGTEVGSATAFGALEPSGFQEGSLTYGSNSLFDAVTITAPDAAAFAVNNISVSDSTVIVVPTPEASTMVSTGLMLAWVSAFSPSPAGAKPAQKRES